MTDSSWEEAMTQLTAAQRNFVKGDAAGIKRLFSHGEDVTVLGGCFGGFEHGWAEVGPRLDWAASHFAGGSYGQETVSATVGSDVGCLVSRERWPYATPEESAEMLLELRVTQVFRREQGHWRLVHRHADPLLQKQEPS
jgi:ketosteroid isomerase-like protein